MRVCLNNDDDQTPDIPAISQ